MRIEQFQYLLEIYHTRSFTTAAANLYVSQPAISEAIKKLEQELGVQLITRLPSSIDFTPVGLETIQLAQQLLDTLAAISANAEQSHAQGLLPPCSLTLFTMPVINESLIVRFLPLFHNEQPQVRFSIYEASLSVILASLPKRPGSIGIFHANPQLMQQALADSALIAGLIIDALQVYALVASDSQLAAKKSLTLQELCTLPLALSSIDANDELIAESLFRPQGLAPQVVFRSNKRELIFDEVRSGQAVALTHSISLTNPPAGLTAIPIASVTQPPGLYYAYSAADVWPHKQAIHHFLDEFIPFCQGLLPAGSA